MKTANIGFLWTEFAYRQERPSHFHFFFFKIEFAIQVTRSPRNSLERLFQDIGWSHKALCTEDPRCN